MGYELERATLEAARNAAVDAYIEARPQLDSIHNRRIFEAGFERAWNGRNTEIDNLRKLLAEWEEGVYDGQDFLRRVRLALHSGHGLSAVPNASNEGPELATVPLD